MIFGLEFAREQVVHPIIVIWAIAFVPITLTLALCWFAGGRNLLRAELFPILFFLTAVPWPPRFEQPITAGLTLGRRSQQARSKRARLSLLPAQFRIEIDFIRADIEPD